MNVTALSEIEQARFNMVEQQIRPWGIFDQRLLHALFAIRRERLVPPSLQALAFSDVELPLIINAVHTRATLLSPQVEASLAHELPLTPTDLGLASGTGASLTAAPPAHMPQQDTLTTLPATPDTNPPT